MPGFSSWVDGLLPDSSGASFKTSAEFKSHVSELQAKLDMEASAVTSRLHALDRSVRIAEAAKAGNPEDAVLLGGLAFLQFVPDFAAVEEASDEGASSTTLSPPSSVDLSDKEIATHQGETHIPVKSTSGADTSVRNDFVTISDPLSNAINKTFYSTLSAHCSLRPPDIPRLRIFPHPREETIDRHCGLKRNLPGPLPIPPPKRHHAPPILPRR